MAARTTDAALSSRTARAKLKPRAKPYWRLIEKGCHLGYYRGARSGAWQARYLAGGTKYVTTTLGQADDTAEADGNAVLSFGQAAEKARAWFSSQSKIVELGGLVGPYSVKDAWEDYLRWFRVHRRGAAQLEIAAKAHILPALGDVQLTKLTAAKLRAWHEGLALAAPRVRSKKGKAPAFREIADDPDAQRRRRVTANRILTVLKAALNHAWREGRIASDDPWRRVKPFRDVQAAKVRYLTPDEIKRLLDACEPAFGRLVRAALLTGCRFGELAALRAGDFDAKAGTLAIRQSKSGKPRYVVLTDEGTAFFRDLTTGQAANIHTLRNVGGNVWGRSHQFRPLREACEAAGIVPAINFHILRHTYASLMVMAGAPLQVVAHSLGHSDTRMTEKHYAHLAPSYVAETIRRFALRLTPPAASTQAEGAPEATETRGKRDAA